MEIMKHYNRKTLISAAMIFLLISFSSYMSLVIFALYINSKAGILLTSVIVALPNMIRFFSGLLTPKIERMLGKKQSLFLAVCIMAVCYIFYVVFKEWKGLLLAGILNGLAELLYQPIIKSIFAQAANDTSGIEFVHRMRYLVICVAGLLGPLAGGWISALCGYEFCLYLSSGLFAAACIPIFFMPRINSDVIVSSGVKGRKRFETARNKKLWAYIISGTIVFIVFSQFESVYSLALDTVYENPVNVYSLLLALNSLFGILLQIYSISRNKKEKKNLSIKQGIMCFQLGFALFAFAFLLGERGLIVFILGVFVYSVGEVVTIPGLDIQIDVIAPADAKSAYFSLAEFRTLGFVSGPVVMSWMLEKAGAVFSCISSIVFLAGALAVNELAKRYPAGTK